MWISVDSDLDLKMRLLQGLALLVTVAGANLQSAPETATSTVRLATEGSTQELCQWETLQASCLPGQVIVVTDAVYGRMKKGRCVKTNFGHLGCHRDVLPEVDRRCSGQPTCNLPVISLHAVATSSDQGCASELMGYLRFAYKCVTVTPCQRDMCDRSDSLQVPANTGVLSSYTTAETRCGSQSCPWVLRAKPGQHLNLTLMDFSHTEHVEPSSEYGSSACHRYVTITEDNVSKDITSCSQEFTQDRERRIYESISNEIHLTLYADSRPSASQFLIHYEVIGCPDFNPPQYSEVKRDGSSVRVVCTASPEVYHLTCTGTEWQGKLGICPGMLVVVGVGVALGVVVGVLLLAAALLYMRRRNREPPIVNRDPLLFDASPFREIGGKPIHLRQDNVPSSGGGSLIYTPEHNYTTTLHPKRPLPVPSPLVPTEDPNFERMQCRECNMAHEPPMTAHLVDPRIDPSLRSSFRSGAISPGTTVIGKHFYETPSFPIQQMARDGSRIHSADGIFRSQMEADEDGKNTRTN